MLAHAAGLDIAALVGIAGAYGGCVVMFVVPACLVHCARVAASRELVGCGPNMHSSPFRGGFWVAVALTWAFAVIIVISLLRLGWIS